MWNREWIGKRWGGGEIVNIFMKSDEESEEIRWSVVIIKSYRKCRDGLVNRPVRGGERKVVFRYGYER